MTPVVDKVYPFIEARDALEFVKNGEHFGKVVVTVGDGV
jgi:NADPH:quinone reductase-like Zn-dependent oxidoreductase